MIRRNFLKAIAAVLCGGVVAKKACSAPKAKFPVTIKTHSEIYQDKYCKIVANTHDEIKIGDILYYGPDGQISNQWQVGHPVIGIAHSNSSQDGWCVVQLSGLI